MTETKVCGSCTNELEISNFHKLYDGHQSICKGCRKLSDVDFYQNRGKKEKLEALEKKNRLLIRKIKFERGCKYCTENEPVALDFHHINGDDKRFEIAGRMKDSTNNLLKEIEACDVVCANCHRKLHAGLIIPN